MNEAGRKEGLREHPYHGPQALTPYLGFLGEGCRAKGREPALNLPAEPHKEPPGAGGHPQGLPTARCRPLRLHCILVCRLVPALSIREQGTVSH